MIRKISMSLLWIIAGSDAEVVTLPVVVLVLVL